MTSSVKPFEVGQRVTIKKHDKPAIAQGTIPPADLLGLFLGKEAVILSKNYCGMCKQYEYKIAIAGEFGENLELWSHHQLQPAVLTGRSYTVGMSAPKEIAGKHLEIEAKVANGRWFKAKDCNLAIDPDWLLPTDKEKA